MKFTKIIKADFDTDRRDIHYYEIELCNKLDTLSKSISFINEEKMSDSTFDGFEKDLSRCLNDVKNMITKIESYIKRFDSYQ